MGEENVGKILSAPPKVSSYVVYSNTDYSNVNPQPVNLLFIITPIMAIKDTRLYLSGKKTCRLNVVNFDTLDLKSHLLIIIFVISN